MKNHKEIKKLLLPYLEGKITKEQKNIVKEHLRICEECKKEIEEYKKIEEGLQMIKFKKPSEEVWDKYWISVYNRIERKIGWIFFSVGTIIILFFAIYQFISELINDSQTPLLLKAGIIALCFGGVVLFVSILREQLFARKKERYKEIEK